MKQGSGNSRMGDQKREPVVHVVNPGGADQLGSMVAKNPTPLYADKRGFLAPEPVSCEAYLCGSQGKHQ